MISQPHNRNTGRRVPPGIAVEGLPFIGAGLALTGLCATFSPPLAVVPLALAGCLAGFFRDPERSAPEPDRYLYAPADGRVMFVEEIHDERFIHGPAYRIAIFLSIVNVHINRSPAMGIVRYREYIPGDFHAAWEPQVEPGNECQYLGLETPRGPIMIAQVAGLLARRIVCRPQIGDRLACGERFGLIKFSSRTDVIFPRSMARPLVSMHDKVCGSLTPVGAYL